MTDIALILFDLNGVLYRYDRDARIGHLAALAGRSPQEVRQAIWESGFEDAGDTGALDAAAYLHGFGLRIGYRLSEPDWLAAQQAAITPIAACLALLARVRAGVACAVLTNNNLLVRQHFATLYPAVAAAVGERVCVSAEFDARKPDPEVYRGCVARLGAAPGAVLFVDDAPANVAGAEAAGLHGYLYTSPDDLAAELQRRGLLAQR